MRSACAGVTADAHRAHRAMDAARVELAAAFSARQAARRCLPAGIHGWHYRMQFKSHQQVQHSAACIGVFLWHTACQSKHGRPARHTAPAVTLHTRGWLGGTQRGGAGGAGGAGRGPLAGRGALRGGRACRGGRRQRRARVPGPRVCTRVRAGDATRGHPALDRRHLRARVQARPRCRAPERRSVRFFFFEYARILRCLVVML